MSYFNPNRARQEYREPQWGIPGTAADAYTGEGGKQFYIGRQSTRDIAASDAHDGTDPRAPMATLQALIDRTAAITAGTGTRQPYLRAHDTVYIQADISESVITGDTTDMPEGVSIIGVGNDFWTPQWSSDVATNPCLTLRAFGWNVANIQFNPPTTSSGIRAQWIPLSNYNASRLTVRDCVFDGAWTGFYGIDLSGAPYDVKVDGCTFRELRGAGESFGIIVTNTNEADPFMCEITNNIFWENENHVGSIDNLRNFNVSLFRGNVFHEGVLIAATSKLDLRGGTRGRNIVTGNDFCGDYSNAGGYYANAALPGNWVGNFAEDLLEVTVADNGITIAVPA